MYASRFLRYLQHWLISYTISETRSTRDLLHTNPVAGQKRQAEYEEYLDKWKTGWTRFKSMSRVEIQQRANKAQRLATDW